MMMMMMREWRSVEGKRYDKIVMNGELTITFGGGKDVKNFHLSFAQKDVFLVCFSLIKIKTNSLSLQTSLSLFLCLSGNQTFSIN
jgi:hypothetical protein